MKSVTNINMNLLSILTTIACILSLQGCDQAGGTATNVTPGSTQSYGYDSAKDQTFRFERMRKVEREALAKSAQEKPEEIGYVNLSLWDYFPITTLIDFETKYPNLKVVSTTLMVKGTMEPSYLTPGIPLKKELDRIISEATVVYAQELQKAKDQNPRRFSAESIKLDIAGAQSSYDAIKAGNVRTFGFAIKGTFKDLEAMAKQEFGGKYIRVLFTVPLQSNGRFSFYVYEPVYANDEKVDAYK